MFYLLLAGGFAPEYMNSGDINTLMVPFRGGGMGINLFAGLRFGVLNVLQLEYRLDVGFLHDFTQTGDLASIEMTTTTPKIYLIKINPLFWQGDPHLAWFIVYGVGSEAKYSDKQASGWKNGDSKIYGLQFDYSARLGPGFRLQGGLSAEYRTVRYNKFDLTGFGSVGRPFTGSFFFLGLHVGIGFGL